MNNKKAFISTPYLWVLFWAISFVCIPVKAQESDDFKRNDLRITIGLKTHTPYYNWYNNEGVYHPYTIESNNDIYQSSNFISPVFGINYMYRFKRWLAAGFTGSFVYGAAEYCDLYNNDVYKSTLWKQFSITPHIRFDWINTKYINFYSSIGMGLSYFCYKRSVNYGNTSNISNNYIITYDVIPIGMTVGRRVYGLLEIGVSNIGIAKAGIGYRF